MRIIAVDFDGTLCRGKWPEIGDANEDIIRALISAQKDGAKLILWTCREGADLRAAVMWCMKHGIEFDAINDNLEENKEYFGNNSRKVYATEYWDDKSVIVTASEDVEKVVIPQADGGLTVKKWTECNVQLVEPGHVAVIPDPIRKKKRWWQIWRCE